ADLDLIASGRRGPPDDRQLHHDREHGGDHHGPGAMNNAELIVATLQAAGVSHGFGIPSGNVLPLIEAMRVGRLPYVLTAHEGSAAFMADVMGRLTGAPGLCIATLGPGATNLTTGVGMPTSIARRSWRSRAICRRRSS